MVGETVGSYRIVRPLSQGAFGQVYLAEHTLIGRQAAVKVLHPEMSRDQDAVVRFFNEARAAATIRHPGLVEVFDFGHHPSGSAFLVMELLAGESLGQRLHHGPLPEELAIHVARQVATATGAAHAAGIVHRDLKPDNLFLVPDADMPGGVRVKVLDFGIAKLSDSSGNRTKTNVIMGTAAYMSPEQCTSAAAVDRRADVYSLGCILFEMVCGRPPFTGDSLTQLLTAHLLSQPPSPRSLAPGLRPELEALILRMLAKDAAARPQSMEEVAASLGAMLRATGAGQGAGFAAGRPSVPPTVAPSVAPTVLPSVLPVTATPRTGARNANAALLAGAVLVALAGVVTGVRHCKPAPPPTVHLAFLSTPAGATVYRAPEMAPLGQTPISFDVRAAPVALNVVLKLKGYQDASASLSADRDGQVQVQLVPLPPPPQPQPQEKKKKRKDIELHLPVPTPFGNGTMHMKF